MKKYPSVKEWLQLEEQRKSKEQAKQEFLKALEESQRQIAKSLSKKRWWKR